MIPLEKTKTNLEPKDMDINPGELVKVRSREEIDSMLDDKGVYKKLPAMHTQYNFCDETCRVKNEINYFYDGEK